MQGATVLISPLSWGFGHAGRMIPVALDLKRRGCTVVFAADNSILQAVAGDLAGIRLIPIPGLKIRYSRRLPQYICIFMQTPRIIASAVREHRVLRRLVREFNPSLIVSDNRFGFFHRKVFSVYVTHQLRIPFPRGLRFMEPVAAFTHRLIINRFDLCMLPDFPGNENLSGRLSHGVKLPPNAVYSGPLSRFASAEAGGETTGSGDGAADNPVLYGQSKSLYACLILSGPEPQRSLFLEKAAEALRCVETTVLSVTTVADRHRKAFLAITFVIDPGTREMRRIITASSLVVARAGYTSVMELFSLGKGAVIVPTPGQPEQEYLGRHLHGRYGFITLEQGKLERLAGIASNAMADTGIASDASAIPGIAQGETKSFADALLEKATGRLPEQQ